MTEKLDRNGTMTVTVVDRDLQSRLWGNGYRFISQVLKTIEISDRCPKCGGPRGKPRLQSYIEDGDPYSVSRWENPCGHLDRYEDVLKEVDHAVAAVRPNGGNPDTVREHFKILDMLHGCEDVDL